MDFDLFLAENGPHPCFWTDAEAAFVYHRKVIAFCIAARNLEQEQAAWARTAFPQFGPVT